jgi:hypothetical protein
MVELGVGGEWVLEAAVVSALNCQTLENFPCDFTKPVFKPMMIKYFVIHSRIHS